jgi:glycosyltransferase involved in cell wall biosynthesis
MVPFIRGGAELLAEGLQRALQQAGHSVETLRLPFQYFPDADIERSMAHARSLSLAAPNGRSIDRLISLQFPTWGIEHPDHWCWMLHQHRPAYDLFDPATATASATALRAQIHQFDNETLAAKRARFTISKRVVERLHSHNGLTAECLYHPPFQAEHYRCADALPYIFFPSRLENLKRQSLVIQAAAEMRSDIKILLAGEGGSRPALEAQIAGLGVGDRVQLLGAIDMAELRAFYANALAVCFPAFDEDYGYVTLEAMLSGKPVITCTDSGGPLEFVIDGHTGWIEAPHPAALAARFDALSANPTEAAARGRAGRAHIEAMGLNWEQVVYRLTRRTP